MISALPYFAYHLENTYKHYLKGKLTEEEKAVGAVRGLSLTYFSREEVGKSFLCTKKTSTKEKDMKIIDGCGGNFTDHIRPILENDEIIAKFYSKKENNIFMLTYGFSYCTYTLLISFKDFVLEEKPTTDKVYISAVACVINGVPSEEMTTTQENHYKHISSFLDVFTNEACTLEGEYFVAKMTELLTPHKNVTV